MTTFNGQAVIVGVVVEEYDGPYATKARKYVEVFDNDSNEWLLKSPEESEDLHWSMQYALVPLKSKLLHIGGNDIGEGKNAKYNYLAFYLDKEFSRWTQLESTRTYYNEPGLGLFFYLSQKTTD